jgi:hypothetical protein
VWIAANTNACFKSSRGAIDARAEQPDRMRGILILVDTTQAGSTAPAYLGRLAASEYRVTAIRADREGNAYVAGVAGSADFPHGEVLDTDTHARASDKGDLGFAAAISKSGSALWSCLLRNIFPAAISVGENGNVVVAGRGADGAALAEIADRGRRLSTLVRSAGAEEFRAVSMTPNGEWALVAGVAATRNASSQHEQETFFAAVPVCRTDRFNAHPLPQSASEEAPGIALGAALDSVAAAWLEKSPAPCRPPI